MAAAITAAVAVLLILSVHCGPRPASPPVETEATVNIPAQPKLSLKPVHRSMREGMRQSYEAADEIILGIYTGITQNGERGRTHFFDRFRKFDKSSWTWGPETEALLPVFFEEMKPEIISEREFKVLSAMDRIGICWDDFEGPRVVYLVEGITTLVFLRHLIDEAGGTSRRILLDTYPDTKDCRAKVVFDLVLRDIAGRAAFR